MPSACVLIADITGSTKLYEQVSQQDALKHISVILGRMRTIIEEIGGHCVKSQGDDTLSFFRTADAAFEAAKTMIHEDWPYGLSLHAGLFFGEVLRHDNDIYGDAVNTAARLASLAKPGELLIGDQGFDLLSPDYQPDFVPMGRIKLKGKKEATRVYSFTADQVMTQTVIFGAPGPKVGRRTESATFKTDGRQWTITEGEVLTIGRADTSDVVLEHSWVSRQHGKLELRESQLEFSDHSSTGSSVLTSDGQQYEVYRRATLLNGEGILVFGTPDHTLETSTLRYATNDLIPD